MPRQWGEAGLWLALWAVATPLIRPVQPSLVAAAVVAAIVVGASLAARQTFSGGLAGRSALWVRAMAVVAAGLGAALAIRVFYRVAYPDIPPFSLAFNVVSDVVWVAVNLLMALGSLRLLQHLRGAKR